jgi:response regulator of citrate/malate metabolism
MAASMGQTAEANEMAAKTAASKQGIDLAKVAYDLGDKKRRLRQGLDQSTVASMAPMIAARTPDVVKYS